MAQRKGFKHSEKTKQLLKERNKRTWQSEELKDKIRQSNKNRWKNKKFRKNVKKAISKAKLGIKQTEKHKKNISRALIKKWQTKEYREKVISLQLKGLFKRPTHLERQMISIIEKHNLPYKYVGDGSFLIGFKNPDFINVNGEKICIEVGNRFHHQNNYIENRKKHFAKYGWKCIVLITDDLKEEEVLNVLQSF